MSERRKWFGTDGIRGKYGVEPMTPEFVWRAGHAAARHFAGGKTEPLFIVGRDTRASGCVLEDSLCLGLLAGGARVTRPGVVPSGAVSLLVTGIGAQAGVMLSASHNDAADNGVKFFDGKGFKLADADELAIERLLEKSPAAPVLSHEIPAVMEFGAQPIYLEMYREALAKTVPSDFSLAGRALVLDAANGAAWGSAANILQNYGADVQRLGCQPDGMNINRDCGSTHPEALQAAVRRHADGRAIGLALDGDADRLIMTDEDGELLDGDEILAIVGTHLLGKRALPKKTIVATVMSNLGLDEAIVSAGGSVARTEVGDRYVLARMREEGCTVGGEQSGHFLFLDHAPSGDGLLSALQVLEVQQQTGKPLRELRRVMRKYLQRLYNLPVKKKTPLERLPKLRAAAREVERRLDGKGRIFIRYSGTENKIRVLLEAADGDLEQLARPVLRVIKTSLGTQPKFPSRRGEFARVGGMVSEVVSAPV
ncbi:MAG: phosphoglucosamine mutase [Verrucomicrobiales bacterium]|jgi:phosphoglucosamine mutase|nr:phosphoglucosamine mutase [Verrucomicrobiales bacterium]